MKYRILAENANDMLIVLATDFKIEYINEKVHQKIMGYTFDDLKNKNIMDLIHPDDFEKIQKTFNQAINKGEGFLQARIKHKNGTYIWTESNGKKFIDEDGKPKFMIIVRDITERKNNAQTIKESEERYRDLADSLPEVIFEIDLDYRITYTNTAASKKFGYSEEEFKKGLKVFQFLAPEDKDFILGNLKSVINGDYVEPLIIKLKKKDGTFFYANIIGRRIFKDNKVIGVRSIIHDITEMKIAQEKIKESEEKFRTIAEQSLLGICIIQNEIVKYVNKNLAELLGYSVEEIIKWRPSEFFKTIHPDDKKMVIELALNLNNKLKNEVRSYEARGIKKNGEIIWLDVYYKIINFKNEPAYLISFMDISERKQAQVKLRESEEKYRFLFEKSPASILLIDTSGKIIDCNPSLEKLICYNRNELIGKRYSKLPIIPKRYLPVLLERLRKIGKGEFIPPLDIELYRKDGSSIWANIESTLVKLGEKTFIIIMGYDISEKKEVENKLKELDKMRKDFIDKASHELKTPITTIYGAYQLLDTLYKDKFDKEQLEIFKLAFGGTKRLKKLVDDLLDISRIESDMFKLEKEEVDISELLKKCIKEMNYLMKVRNQTYTLSTPNSMILKIDKSRIELVLINLLSNAIKYTPEEGNIDIKLDKFDDFVEVSIADTGIGLTENEISQLFKKFSKIRKPLYPELDVGMESTGLGLHITKEILKLHGGNIWAESEGKNKGSTFRFRLPIN
ncbi:MAG: PAS domain S-box protein [Candidatus Heimdallarchaeota archaeon]